MKPSEYIPRDDVIGSLRAKTLVMVIGPTSIGKSSIMSHVVSLDHHFARVSGFTTRAARANDEPGMYRYLSEDEVGDLVTARDAVQYIVHPTTGKIYGSEPQDYPAEYNLQDTLTTAVDNYRHLPFARIVTISLTADPKTWLEWLSLRFPEPSEDRTKRLVEAKQSIEWSLSQSATHLWLLNQPDNLDETAKQLIELVKNESLTTETPPQAAKLLILVNDLLSYK